MRRPDEGLRRQVPRVRARGSTRVRPGGALLTALFAGLCLLPSPASGQRPGPAERAGPAPLVSLTAYGAVSLREGFDGFRFARDMRTYGVRATWLRRLGVQPWLDGGGFHRPRFTCVPSVPCTDQGWLVRLGVRLPLYSSGRSGLRGALLAGAGAAFAEETVPAYLFGLGFDWPLVPRLAPTVEMRWESVVEVNSPMIAVGVRLDL